MAAPTDAPVSVMRDRLAKLTAQRQTLLKELTERSRAAAAEVTRRKNASIAMAAVAGGEPYQALKAAENAYSTAFQQSAVLLESLNSQHVEKKVKLPLTAYDADCLRPMTAVFSDRDQAFVDAKKAVEAHNSARLRGISGQKLADAETSSLEARRRAHNTQVLFEENSLLFEYKRVTDAKKFLQHMLMSEMAYHSACMEHFTHALQELGKVDPNDAMDGLKAELIHPSLPAEQVWSAATEQSSPLVGVHVPPELKAPSAAVFSPPAAGSAQMANFAPPAIVSTQYLPSSSGIPAGPPSVQTTTGLPGQPPVSISPPAAASLTTAAQPAQTGQNRSPPAPSALPPGAIQALSTMPSPWATTATGIVYPGSGSAQPSVITAPAPVPTATAGPASGGNTTPKGGIFGGRSSIFGFGKGSKSPSPGGRNQQTGNSGTDYTAMRPTTF